MADPFALSSPPSVGESSRAASGGVSGEDRGLGSELSTSDIDAPPAIFGHSSLRMEDLDLMIGLLRPRPKTRAQCESVI